VLQLLKSIRARLTFWYSLVVLATLVVFGLIAYTYSTQKLLDTLDLSLRNEVKWIRDYVAPKGGKVKPSRKYSSKPQPSPVRSWSSDSTIEEPPDPDDVFWGEMYSHILVTQRKTLVEVTDKRGGVIFRSSNSPEDLVIGEVPMNTVRIITIRSEDGKDLRVAAMTTEPYNIYVAYPLDELRSVLDNLYAIFLILIPIALALSVGGGWFLANKALRPVDLITKTARRITAENLDQQIPAHDIDDEIGRLIHTLNGMISRLRESFERIKQFTVDASHELRTPLTIMRGEVELALGDVREPEEYRRVLVSNLEENLRLASIIDNLLTLSKADFGQDDLMREPVRLRELIDSLYEDAVIIAMKKKIQIGLTNREEIMVNGDLLRLRQLFLNLIDNAIKYTPEGGSVDISVARHNGMARINVRDSGIGIPAGEQSKIFDRFYRVDKARSREVGGTGLGLAIAKMIAEQHKGTIGVLSAPDKGSTFSISLPVSG
jgi:heavy metal sensor kinase